MSELKHILNEMKRQDKDRKKLSDDIHDLKVRIFEPDNGLYARVKDNTDFRKGATTWLRVIGGTVTGIVGKMFYAMFTNGK